MRQRNGLIVTARRFLGTPFHHQGRRPGLGLDCAGVIVCAAQQYGLAVHDVADYGRLPHGSDMQSHLGAAGMVTVDRSDMLPGDVLLMRFVREAQHLALATDRGVLHAYQQIGRVVEHRLDETWRRRILAVYRFPEFL